MKLTSIPLLAFLAVSVAAVPAAVPETSSGNDYPYKSSCPGAADELDPWKFYKCYCTSFVAYALNARNKKKFTDFYDGQKWGDANHWDTAARAAGVTVNQTPSVGAIAQSNAGSAGHVAWVSKVDGSKVTVEEYNYNCKKCYGTRTVTKTAFDNYIHL